MSTSTAMMTADELLELPRGQYRYELINGELKTMSPSGHKHGRICARLAALLWHFVTDRGLGEVFGAETGFILTSNPDTVLAPDVAFINKELASRFHDTPGYWPGPPDIAVEVLSPGESGPKAKKKTEQWLGYGAKQVWIVNPKNETVTVHWSSGASRTFSSGETFEADDELRGFSVAVSDILK